MESTFRAPGDFRAVGIAEFNVEGWTSPAMRDGGQHANPRT